MGNICENCSNKKRIGSNTEIKLKKECLNHNAPITSVLLTVYKEPQRILTSSEDCTVLVYSLETKSFLKQIIKEEDLIYFISEMKNGNLIVCGRGPFLKIYSIDSMNNTECIFSFKESFSKGTVFKAVELNLISKGIIAAIGSENNIKFWDPSKNYELVNVIETESDLQRSFMELKNGQIVVGGLSSILYFYDYNSKKCLEKIEGVDCCNQNAMFYESNKDFLLVGGYEMIFLINTNTKKLIKKYNDIIPTVGGNCFCLLEEGVVLAGLKNGDILKLNSTKYEVTDTFRECTKYKTEINDLIYIGKRIFISVSNDYYLRYWYIPEEDEEENIPLNMHKVMTLKTTID